MPFSIHLSPEEKRLATNYAHIHRISIAEAFKRALFEQIEDEYDAEIAKKTYAAYIASGKKSRPISEIWSELDADL